MKYFRLKKDLNGYKKGSVFCLGIQFRIAVSERFNWAEVYGISEQNIIKYKNYLKQI